MNWVPSSRDTFSAFARLRHRTCGSTIIRDWEQYAGFSWKCEVCSMTWTFTQMLRLTDAQHADRFEGAHAPPSEGAGRIVLILHHEGNYHKVVPGLMLDDKAGVLDTGERWVAVDPKVWGG